MGVWAQSASDAWVVGWNTTILHWDGSKWAPDTSSGVTANFSSIWGSGAQDIWIAGKGMVLRKDPFGWTAQDLTGTQGLFNDWSAVGGSGPLDVWVVGDGGLMLHYDGKGWKDFPKVSSMNLYGLRFVGPTDAWAVGQSGTLLHHTVP